MPDGYDKSALQLASTASNQILKFHYNREFTEPKQTPPAGLLFHYTTADGLKGIIEQNELWATSAYFLNDTAEITYGYGLLNEVLDEWIAKNPRREESMSLGLARDLQGSFRGDLLSMDIVEPIYLACFCENDNLLGQWRTYGQSGGYSIGLKVPSDGIGRGFKPEPNVYTSRWAKVEYDRNEQAKKCQTILDSVLPIFDDADTARAISAVYSHPFVGYSGIRRIMADILLEEIVGFKNKAFEDEKEWRNVVRRRVLVKQGTDDGGQTPTPVYFRSLRGSLVPYVKLIPIKSTEKLPVDSIRSGPSLNKATAGMAVRMILDKNGFSNVRVEGSDISVKF